MIWVRKYLLTLVVAGSLAASSAQASVITQTFDFQANNFSQPTLFDSVSGSITVTWDTSAVIGAQTTGVVVNSGLNALLIGDSLGTAVGIFYAPGTSLLIQAGNGEWSLTINDPTSANPGFGGMDYAIFGQGAPLDRSFSSSGTVTLEGSSVSTTPLPGALPLFLTGLTGAGLLLWRRKKQAAIPA